MGTEQATKRRGMLYVSVAVWEGIKRPETNEAWHKALLLPDDFEIERIQRSDDLKDTFEIAVLTDAIPESESHISQVLVMPHYALEYGDPVLTEIRLVEWNGEKYRDIASQKYAL